MPKNTSLLHTKHEKFQALWANTGFDPTKRAQCLKNAGYKVYCPTNQVRGIMDAIRNNDLLQAEMDEQGISIPQLVAKIKELLECKHPLKPENADNAEQRKTLEMAMRLKDLFPAKRFDIKKTSASFNFDMETIQRAEEATGDTFIDAEIISEEEALESAI